MALVGRMVWTVTLIGMITALAAIVTAKETRPATHVSGQQMEAVDADQGASDPVASDQRVSDPAALAGEPEKATMPTSTVKPWRVATEELLEK